MSSVIDEIEGMRHINTLRDEDEQLTCDIQVSNCNDKLKKELNTDVDKYFSMYFHQKPFFEEISNLNSDKRPKHIITLSRMLSRNFHHRREIAQHNLRGGNPEKNIQLSFPEIYERFLSQDRCLQKTQGCSPEQLNRFIQHEADVSAKTFEITHIDENPDASEYDDLPVDEITGQRVVEREVLDREYQRELSEGREQESSYFEEAAVEQKKEFKTFAKIKITQKERYHSTIEKYF